MQEENKEEVQGIMKIELPKKKYKTIVVDPPWPVKKIVRKVRPNQEPFLDYPTMSIEEIKNFPIRDLIDPDVGCHLYLWSTDRFVRKNSDAMKVMEAWQITFKVFLIWHKNVGFTPFGTGWQIRHEFVLWGTVGKLPLLKIGAATVFGGKVRQHSRKPDEFYDLVKLVSPDPRIDVFSREKRDGFDQYGDETNKF